MRANRWLCDQLVNGQCSTLQLLAMMYLPLCRYYGLGQLPLQLLRLPLPLLRLHSCGSVPPLLLPLLLFEL